MVTVHPGLDATPERLAKSEASEFINPAKIDSSEQPISNTRRFRDAWIDRMLRRGQLTYSQWFACDWYARLHHDALTPPRVVSGYGTGSGGDGCASYGQPRNQHQWDARKVLRKARAILPANAVGQFDMVVIEGHAPPFVNGKSRDRFIERFARMAQDMAEWINAPGA